MLACNKKEVAGEDARLKPITYRAQVARFYKYGGIAKW